MYSHRTPTTANSFRPAALSPMWQEHGQPPSNTPWSDMMLGAKCGSAWPSFMSAPPPASSWVCRHVARNLQRAKSHGQSWPVIANAGTNQMKGCCRAGDRAGQTVISVIFGVSGDPCLFRLLHTWHRRHSCPPSGQHRDWCGCPPPIGRPPVVRILRHAHWGFEGESKQRPCGIPS